MELRPYQQEAVEASLAAEQRGVRRQLGVAATGLGKTIIFAALAGRRSGRTLILAHRDELIEQAVHKIGMVVPTAGVGVVKAERDEVRAPVVVASVQTLSRPNRLARLVDPPDHAQASLDGDLLDDDRPFDLVVVDEAHHAMADSYRAILAGLKAGDPDGPLLLGVTATPDRGDGKGLDAVFDEIVWQYDVEWGITHGYLCDLRGRRVTLDTFDASRLKVSRGDYEVGAAGRALSDADAPEHVVRAWKHEAAGRRTIVFTPTVALADEMASAFNHAGVAAAMVHGGTPLDERRRILRHFSTGHVHVVANCAVLTEGFDEPRADCIVIARPTKSRALYAQMVGRGTRRHPDKTDCLVLDVVGASAQHSLVTVPSLFGIEQPERVWSGGSTVMDALASEAEAKVAAGRLRVEEADLFKKVRDQNRGLAWLALQGDRPVYQLRLTATDTLKMGLTANGLWVAGIATKRGAWMPIAKAERLEDVAPVAEDYAREHGEWVFTSPKARWRGQPASEKQVALLWKFGVDGSKMTKGEAGEALDRLFASRRRGGLG